jgi:hypothetical protein
MKTIKILVAINLTLGTALFGFEKLASKHNAILAVQKEFISPVRIRIIRLDTNSSNKNNSRSSGDLKLSRNKPGLVYTNAKIKKNLFARPKVKSLVLVKTLINSSLKEKIVAEIKSDSVEQDLKTTGGTIVESYAVSDGAGAIAAAKIEEKHPQTGYDSKYAVAFQKETGLEDYSYSELLERAEKLKKYAKQNGYCTDYAFLINMGIKSGKKRFIVMDLSTMMIISRGMVSHGRGKEKYTLDKTYSNEPGSNCTALGMYKIGKSYTGVFGASYKLFGLQQSNSNAYKRFIVLHAMNTIPENEIEYPIFQSEGCPSVSPPFLKEISSIITKNSKPVLMWIFDTEKESQFLQCSN